MLCFQTMQNEILKHDFREQEEKEGVAALE